VVQLIPRLGWFAYPAIAVTFLAAFYSLNLLFYWNRRIQTIANTPIPDIGEQDSLIFLDDHYSLIQYKNEKSHRRYFFTNFKINPPKGSNEKSLGP
jgi:hypothetical protein